MTRRTEGTRQPYSIESASRPRISVSGRPPRFGVKPRSRIRTKATQNMTASTTARRTKGTPRFVTWAM